ncbi:hypothetical protein JOM56_015294, partial [Amanita muscaria]
EAKRHQPSSVIYILSLAGWCAAMEERPRPLSALYYRRSHLLLTSRHGSGQPGDIKSPHGGKDRVLEELHIASPLEPRQPTAAGLALQDVNDQRTIALLKYRLGPILTELKRKYKRYCKRASEEFIQPPRLFLCSSPGGGRHPSRSCWGKRESSTPC